VNRAGSKPSILWILPTIVALADTLGTSPPPFFQFDKEANSEKVLRKRIEGLISRASADELQRAYRILRVLLEP
jgi:hypothetical protein